MSVRPGNIFAICAHWLPYLACNSAIKRSSSADQGAFDTFGFKWLCHLKRKIHRYKLQFRHNNFLKNNQSVPFTTLFANATGQMFGDLRPFLGAVRGHQRQYLRIFFFCPRTLCYRNLILVFCLITNMNLKIFKQKEKKLNILWLMLDLILFAIDEDLKKINHFNENLFEI